MTIKRTSIDSPLGSVTYLAMWTKFIVQGSFLPVTQATNQIMESVGYPCKQSCHCGATLPGMSI